MKYRCIQLGKPVNVNLQDCIMLFFGVAFLVLFLTFLAFFFEKVHKKLVCLCFHVLL